MIYIDRDTGRVHFCGRLAAHMRAKLDNPGRNAKGAEPVRMFGETSRAFAYGVYNRKRMEHRRGAIGLDTVKAQRTSRGRPYTVVTPEQIGGAVSDVDVPTILT